MTAARPAPPTTPADTAQAARTDLITDRPPVRRIVRSVAAMKAALLVLGATLASPVAAAAAPAPCEQAQSYAAQSGAEFIRLNKLDLRPAGVDAEPTNDAGLADAKSAMIADGTVNAAAVTRLLDAADAKALGEPLTQSAPPTTKRPVHRQTAAGEVGPFALGDGTLSSRAAWDPRMACGAKTGDVTRAETGLAEVGIGGELVRVPEKLGSLSTTALNPDARTVARADVSVRGFDLLDGAVHVRVVRPPALLASMSTRDGGEIRYLPAVLDVSGEGLKTTRLDTAGDDVELALGEDAEEPDAQRETEATTLSDLLSGSAKLSGLTKGVPLPVPTVPGVPPVSGADNESAQVTGPGTRLRIALGDVRQAVSGHSIAAKATAIKIAITQGPSKDDAKQGYGNNLPNRSGVILDLDVGILEAAAVAPEPAGSGGVQAANSGNGGGLPITGPQVTVLATAGGVLLAAGAAALLVGVRRRRRFQP